MARGKTSVEDDEGSGRPSNDSFSDAIFVYLNRNAQASCQEIAKDLLIPKITILYVLDEMRLRFFVARWMRYKLSPELKAKRIEICQEMLEIREKLGPGQNDHIIAGDKYWIYCDNNLCGQCTADRAPVSPRIQTTISWIMTMISTSFTRQGLISVETLTETERFISPFSMETNLLNIIQSVSVFCPKMQAQCYWMYLDSAKPHNSALSFQKTEELGFTRLTQPHYSPDLTPCSFFLFGYLKTQPHGENFRSQNEVISVVRAFDQDPHSNALANLPRMDREITQVCCE
jgi:histone-lysine N-methyltransferase SETMAR